jgi:Kef-type K+ transport system membrane component KefB
VAAPAGGTETLLAVTMAGIALALIAGTLFGALARRWRQPPVVGEIAAGIVLGPSLLGLLPGQLTERVFPADVRPLLSAIAQVGLLLFVFTIGWRFESGLLRHHRGLAAAVSLSSVVLSFGLGAGLAVLLYAQHSTVRGERVPALAFVLFVGAALAVTAFPVLARILADSGLLPTRVGTLALARAAVDDVVAWCLLALVSAIVTGGGSGGVVRTLVLSLVFVAAMLWLVRPLLARLVRCLLRGRGSPYLLAVLAAGVLLSSYATTWIGIHAIFGAFLFGYVMPREPAELLRRQLGRPLDTLGQLLLPVFFVVIGLGVDIGRLAGHHYLELAAVLAVACAGKVVGAAGPARVCGMSWRDAGTLGVLMNTRGLTGLVVVDAGVGLGVLDPPMFTMMVVMALVTTAMAAPLLPRADPLPGTDHHARHRASRQLARG